MCSLRAVNEERGVRRVVDRKGSPSSRPRAASLVATRFNLAIREFYERLCSKGKPKKVALTACMRKLLIILAAVLRNRTAWRLPEARTA